MKGLKCANICKINDLAKFVRSNGRKMTSGNYNLEVSYYPDGHLYVGGKMFTCLKENDLLKEMDGC